MQHGQFRRRRTNIEPAAPAHIAGPNIRDVGDAVVINVLDHVDIDVIHGAVICETVVIPISALITAAYISEAVIDATIKPDMGPPIAVMPGIPIAVKAPIRRSPERTDERSQHPDAGYPVIASRRIVPGAGRPQIIGTGALGLAVLRNGRRGLLRINGRFRGIVFVRVRGLLFNGIASRLRLLRRCGRCVGLLLRRSGCLLLTGRHQIGLRRIALPRIGGFLLNGRLRRRIPVAACRLETNRRRQNGKQERPSSFFHQLLDGW